MGHGGGEEECWINPAEYLKCHFLGEAKKIFGDPNNNSDLLIIILILMLVAFSAVAQIATHATRATRIGMSRSSKLAVKKTAKYSDGMQLF